MTEARVLLWKVLAKTALLKVILKDWSVFTTYIDCVAVHTAVLLQDTPHVPSSAPNASLQDLTLGNASILETVVAAMDDMTKSWPLEEEIYPTLPAWNSS